jgi:ACS family hexuronate transporter-like MFS transporter
MVVIAMRYRWTICALLFYATTLNYLDRQVLGVLAPLLQRDLGWSEAQYGYVITSFQIAYGISFLFFGRFIDAIGTRLGYALSVTIWGLASLSHTLASTARGFAICRFGLGLGEAGNFPAAVKTVAEVFPQRQRAVVTGVFNSGSNVGAMIAPLVMPWLAYRYGWRWCFVLTSTLGAIWVVLWLGTYDPSRHTASTVARDVWRNVIHRRELWGIMLARFCTDPVWWFLLYWTPKYLGTRTGIDLRTLALPLVIIYLAADAGSLFGGWLSSMLIGRGLAPVHARKLGLLTGALMVLPLAAVPHVSSLWVLVGLLGSATAGHQAWAANVHTIVSDYFPQSEVASVSGICGSAASLSGAGAATIIGLILQWTGSYTVIFSCAAVAYLCGLSLLQIVARPRHLATDEHSAA